MNETVNIQNNKIEISIPIPSPIEVVEKWKLSISDFLSVFLNRKVDIITVDPQKYSITYELGNEEHHLSRKHKYLLNRNILLNNDVLKSLLEFEDFERGLLLIVLDGDPRSVIEYISHLVDSREESIVMEDDGKRFIWYNPSSEKEIKSLRDLLK